MHGRHGPCKEDACLDGAVSDHHADCNAHKSGGVVFVGVDDAVDDEVVDDGSLHVGERRVELTARRRKIQRERVTVSVKVAAEDFAVGVFADLRADRDVFRQFQVFAFKGVSLDVHEICDPVPVCFAVDQVRIFFRTRSFKDVHAELRVVFQRDRQRRDVVDGVALNERAQREVEDELAGFSFRAARFHVDRCADGR